MLADHFLYLFFLFVCSNQYNILVPNGTWKAKSHKQELFVALTAKISHLKGNLKLSKPLLDKLKSIARNAGHEGRKRVEKKRNKKKKVDKKNQKKDEMWKKKAPGPNDSKTKEVRNRTYHWCKHHMSWTMHKPTDCHLNPMHLEYQPPQPQEVQVAGAQPLIEPPAQTHQATA